MRTGRAGRIIALALTRGIERALSGQSAGIVAWKIDRFSRTTEHGLRDLRRLKDAGARLAFVVEDIDTATVYGAMVYTILLAVSTAFLESVKAGWVEAKTRASSGAPRSDVRRSATCARRTAHWRSTR